METVKNGGVGYSSPRLLYGWKENGTPGEAPDKVRCGEASGSPEPLKLVPRHSGLIAERGNQVAVPVDPQPDSQNVVLVFNVKPCCGRAAYTSFILPAHDKSSLPLPVHSP